MKHKELITMIISAEQNKMAGVGVNGDFLLFAVWYLLILEPYYFFKNAAFKKKWAKIVCR